MCLKPVNLAGSLVPCGKCVECCVSYTDSWSVRCMDELKAANGVGCMLTLTYDNDHVPADMELRRSDLVKFIKRLRYYLKGKKVRYFYCGEYGGKRNRPHFHLILFGWIPPDAIRYKGDYYNSCMLSDIWKSGYVSVIMPVSEKVCQYTAKYLQKLDTRYHEVKPFVGMSRRPGLGFSAVSPEMLLTGTRVLKKKTVPLPRYYINKLDEQGWNVAPLKATRAAIAKDHMQKNTEAFLEDYDAKLKAFV